MNEHENSDSAAHWAVRLHERPLTPVEQTELDAWLAQAPHHSGALLRARAAWLDLDRLGALEGPGHAAVAPVSQATHRLRTRRRAWRWAAALAACMAGLALVVFTYEARLRATDEFETRVGEVRRIALPDGSSVTLNSDSRAVVSFEKNGRAVALQRGEALFEVAKDHSRPFLVSSGSVTVRAVGTVFAVRALPEAVAVTVTEGVVEITQPEAPPQRVTVNERATVHPAQPVQVAPDDPADVVRTLAWRSGQLSFSGESLADAVAEMNRYSTRHIDIEDPELAARPVVGIFRIGDIDAFAQATAVALDAVVRADERSIHLGTRKTP